MQLKSTLLAGLLAISTAVTVQAQSWGYTNLGYFCMDIVFADDGSTWVVGYGGDDPD